MTVKIGWALTLESEMIGKYEQGLTISPHIMYDPERYKRIAEIKTGRWRFTTCPAFIQYNRNLFTLRSPCDFGIMPVDLSEKKGNGWWGLEAADGHENDISPDGLRRLFQMSDDPYDRVDYDKPVLQMRLGYVFFADEPVTIQQLPLIHDNTYSPVRTVTGEFDIHAWQRAINWGFEWRDTDKPLIVKRGDPISNIKFIVHRDPTEAVDLVKLRMSPQIENAIYRTSSTPAFIKNSFKLFEKARLTRPKKFITKDNIWKQGD
jgi:hypothetical protein